LLATTLASAPGFAQQVDVDFGRQVRPLLAEKCFGCHGLDAERRESKLRLDTKEGLFSMVESGDLAIVPGKSGESAVYQRLISDDPDLKMPPKEAKQITADEIGEIQHWIDKGAKWQQHWSLISPVSPPLPPVRNAKWPQNAIDYFVLNRLEKAKLSPSTEAAKTALLRRVTFDLTGLPPTVAELDNFLADKSGKAYEKVIDRLLQSPSYGEHMARYWLDAARYGDTHGLHLDNFRQIWPYRDWVIKAFNTNMPFDQFTVEQLAGDLLPGATNEQKIATGFNRCNVTTSEGGVIPEEYFVHYTNDRVATMSTVWMGISMGCVTCHDHKFDPFEMKDFYQLYAFFNSLDGPVMDGNRQDTPPVLKVFNAKQRNEIDTFNQQLAQLGKLLTSPIDDVDQAQQAWETTATSRLTEKPKWTTLHLDSFSSSGGATLTRLEDESILASGKAADQEIYELLADVEPGNWRAIRLEALVHKSLTAGGAGRSINSNVVLSEFETEVNTDAEPDKWLAIPFTLAWADHEQTDGNFKIANAIDGKKETGWAIAGHQKKGNRTAIFVARQPFVTGKVARLRIRLRHESIYAKHQFGRLRLSVSESENIPETNSSIPADIAKLLAVEATKRTTKQHSGLLDYYRNKISKNEKIVQSRNQVVSLTKRRDDLEKGIPTTLIWKELAKPKPAFILQRGAYDKPGEPVTRNTPAALPPLPALPEQEIPNRLHLARWLMSAEHPLVARVTVNRIWQQYFGIGIVETSEDFGSQGTPPSHPQLLDWLAVDFREHGWDIKRLHKQIVMSATYRQSAKIAPGMVKRDPKNRLLARGPRFRLDAEVIRDAALSLSGLLVPKIGGPSVKPYQPPGVWYAVGYTDSNTARFKRDSSDALYRRSLYTFWKRTAPPPTMATLDAPSRETCTVRRSRTNTPLAALALMNDEQFVEASRAFAQRIMTEGGTTVAERAAFAFRSATTRYATADELAVLTELHQAHLAKFQGDKEAAAKLIQIGESKPDDRLDPSELATWTMIGNLLLNLDETVTKN